MFCHESFKDGHHKDTHLNYSSIATENTNEIPFKIFSFFISFQNEKVGIIDHNRAISEKSGSK